MNLSSIIKRLANNDANQLAKKNYLNTLLNIAISRSSASASTRKIDPKSSQSWEFSGFSQNGEDGIIDHLLTGLKQTNKYFIEIGSGNGLENNTGYLAHIKKFAGLQIEGNPAAFEESIVMKPWLVKNMNWFVNSENVVKILEEALFLNPDLFSIDIDGMDYYITKLLLQKGLKPKIIIVEYNSAFGPERSITIPYDDQFNMFKTNFPYLYYGVSLRGWHKLLSKFGYDFLTVESNGVNAFFVQKNEFINGFCDQINGIDFKENLHQFRTFKKSFEGQFDIIKNLPFFEI